MAKHFAKSEQNLGIPKALPSILAIESGFGRRYYLLKFDGIAMVCIGKAFLNRMLLPLHP